MRTANGGWRAVRAAGLLALVVAPLAARAGDSAAAAGPRADRVVVISIDGLRADAVIDAWMPRLRALAAQGAYCPWAETIRPSITLPSHISMLTGLDYARHGVTWNDYRPGVIGHPTLFSVAHAAGRSTALFFGKVKFRTLAIPGTVDWMYGDPPPPSFPLFGRTLFPTWAFGVAAALHGLVAAWTWWFLGAARRRLAEESGAGGPGRGRRAAFVATGVAVPVLYGIVLVSLGDVPLFYGSLVRGELSRKPARTATLQEMETGPTSAGGIAKAFARAWSERRFDMTFVHLRDPDEAGHRSGWMSPAYLRALDRSDRAVGAIVDTVRGAGDADRVAVIVTADHGGSGRRHYAKADPDKPEHVRIPWICVGPGVKPDLVIGRVVRVFDTLPTALAWLGLPPPEGLDGRVVWEVLP